MTAGRGWRCSVWVSWLPHRIDGSDVISCRELPSSSAPASAIWDFCPLPLLALQMSLAIPVQNRFDALNSTPGANPELKVSYVDMAVLQISAARQGLWPLCGPALVQQRKGVGAPLHELRHRQQLPGQVVQQSSGGV